jgi:penicillin amidase
MRSALLLCLLFFTTSVLSAQNSFQVEGLSAPVEIKVDQWGVAHIYAQNEADLFFAQGYYAARDRLFQFEVWRRQATGTVAEILGPRELNRDIGTRLFQFRGDMDTEMAHYHPRGILIIESFTKGVNAYIKMTKENPDLLPLEFGLLDIEPEYWTTDIVISRHQGLLGNIEDELRTARAVAKLGPEKVQELSWFHPKQPDLTIDPAIDPALFEKDILELYNAYRRPVRFQPEDIIGDARNDLEAYRGLAEVEQKQWDEDYKAGLTNIGSNNWIVSGEHTASGYPMMANDPHRTQAVPSLRYMVHLHAPGWNVIGGGEPEIPGVSIGHNEHGAWGLTVFRTDAEDLYVYQTNPDNPNQYWYKGAWEDMKIIKDTIPVKGQDPVVVDLKYTRHGPVVFEQENSNTACAVRCGWLEYGGSPYLASLRMDQAKTFEEFREACNFSHIPGENMIWADREGNIGWQAVGIAPIRKNFSGMVPVPGDGRYEWDGYLPIIAKPNLYNPESGIFATANENVTPNDYEHWEAIGFSWSDPFRGNRVREVLASGRKHSLADMARLQTDYLSIPARTLVPLLAPLSFEDNQLAAAKAHLMDWDYQLRPNSIAAAIYVEWEKALSDAVFNRVVPSEGRDLIRFQLKQVIDFLLMPDGHFGKDALAARDQILKDALQIALKTLKTRVGEDMNQWQYGQEKLKHIVLRHPLSSAVSADVRAKLEVGPAPRGGYSHTVNSTGGNYNQSSGASFRIIVDTGDWDRCLATNSPGQSGDPENKNYKNLFDTWAKDQYFPLFFSTEKVNSVTAETLYLKP